MSLLPDLCPICLQKPNLSCLDGTDWYCHCTEEHNKRIGIPTLSTVHRYHKDEIIRYWNKAVHDYILNNTKLPKKLANGLFINDLIEEPFPCCLCGVIPKPKLDETRYDGESEWYCGCKDQKKHPENKSARTLSIAGPEELFGSGSCATKEEAIRTWNENVLEWEKNNVKS